MPSLLRPLLPVVVSLAAVLSAPEADAKGAKKLPVIGVVTDGYVRDLDETLGRTEWEKIAHEIEAKPKPIYIVYSRNMRFYDRHHIEQLELPPLLLSAVVEFYSSLNSVYVQSDGIAGKIFPRISGRCSATPPIWVAPRRRMTSCRTRSWPC